MHLTRDGQGQAKRGRLKAAPIHGPETGRAVAVDRSDRSGELRSRAHSFNCISSKVPSAPGSARSRLASGHAMVRSWASGRSLLPPRSIKRVLIERRSRSHAFRLPFRRRAAAQAFVAVALEVFPTTRHGQVMVMGASDPEDCHIRSCGVMACACLHTQPTQSMGLMN
jgi:hypothetical protein